MRLSLTAIIVTSSLILAFICLPNLGFSLEVEHVLGSPSELKGSSIQQYAHVSCSDPRLSDLQNPSSLDFTDTRALGEVYLRIDHDETSYVSAYSVEVIIGIQTQRMVGGSLQSFQYTTSLYIGYDPLALTAYKDYQSWTIEDCYFTDATISDVLINGQSILGSIPANLIIGTKGKTYRYYDPEPTFSIAFVSAWHNSAEQSWTVSWPAKNGVEAYDLEWTYIDNYAADGSPIGFLDYYFDGSEFEHNATRVRIKENEYDIPLTYEQGYVVYRVRPIWLVGEKFEQVFEGRWSDYGFPGGAIYYYDDFFWTNVHESDLNWQFTATYAESGKRKEVIKYFDGSLRERQAVTKLYEQEETVVGEKVYDHQGRPVVEILPVPTKSVVMQYYRKFNQNTSGEPYSKNDFDLETSSCVNSVTPLSAESGAGLYYSTKTATNNHDTSDLEGYVANAGGYPFVITEYMDDQTGRIKRQSGVGSDHRLRAMNDADAHDTRYYYGTPTQVELDRLFGTEIGYANHYKKIMTMDPNGQLSVTYQDMSGKTIATALAGEEPDNLDILPSNESATDVTEDLLVKNDERLTALEISYPITVSSQGTYDFVYKNTPQVFASCLPQGMCQECVYKVQISLVDECGDELMSGQGGYSASIGTADGFCETPIGQFVMDKNSSSGAYSGMEIEDLPIGQYTVTKKLMLDEAAVQHYADQYIESQTCLRPFSDFFYQIVDSMRIDEQCGEGEAEEMDICEMKYKQMLIDVSPGGQYAYFDYNPDNEEYSARNYPLSVLNWANWLPGNYPVPLDPTKWNSSQWFTKYYSNPNLVFKDENGNDAYVYYNGHKVRPNELPLGEFVTRFQPSWAETLVQFHPEYCYYQWCIGNAESNAYDQLMLSTDSYVEALDLGLLNPLEVPSAPSVFLPVPDADLDPYFSNTSNGQHLGRWLDMATAILNYVDIDPGSGEDFASMWDVAVMAKECNDADSYTGLSSCLSNKTLGNTYCLSDAEWEIFRGLYLSQKRKIQEMDRAVYALDNNCYNGCIGDPDVYTTSGESQTCYFLWSWMYEDKHKIFGSLAESLGFDGYDDMWLNASNLTGLTGDLQDNNCESTCEGYANYWMEQLSGCSDYLGPGEIWGDDGNPSTTNTYETIRAEMIAICMAGCDESNPLGSSTVPAPVVFGANHEHSSFEEILKYHISLITLSMTNCTADLIKMPLPYDHHYLSAHSAYPYLDVCACDWMMEMRDQYNDPNVYRPAEVQSLQDFMFYVSGVEFFDVTERLCACDEEWSDVLENWPDGADDNLLARQLSVPEFITCDECYPCQDIMDAYDDLVDKYAEDPDFEQNEHKLLANYMNSTFGLNLSYAQYLDFLEKCRDINGPTGRHYSATLTQEADEIETFLDYLARTQLILDPQVELGNIPGFANLGVTIFGGVHPQYWDADIDWTGPATMPKLGTTGYAIDISFVNTEGANPVTVCTLQLEVPSNYQSVVQNGLFNAGYLTGNGDLAGDTYNDPDCDIEDFTLVQSYNYTIYGTSDCVPIMRCEEGEQELCHSPLTYKLPKTDCKEDKLRQAASMAWDLYWEYLMAEREKFVSQYRKFCISNTDEEFTMTYPAREYHYTLYYYDRGGNLVQTIPPEGVVPITSGTSLDAVKTYRDVEATGGTGTPVLPPHNFNLASNYKYNSFNQVFEQTTPDGGTTEFWYDANGRLVASQNAKQAVTLSEYPGNPHPYSYTIYDGVGRIKEVGQIYATIDPPSFDINDPAWPGNWGQYPEEMVKTYYDIPLTSIPTDVHQKNLRNRVASITYDDGGGTYDYATHYTYDAHGNVDTLWQDYVPLATIGQELKKIAYGFDLVSGNVKEVAYQKGFTDQFFHRYTYDSDNRIIETHTSKDGIIWDRDAGYSYYRHGPLARMELGEHNVQGVDYAYTIHGWIKGVNANVLTASKDIGRDGNPNGPNWTFARDAYGYTLSYYEGDYIPINQRNTLKPQTYFLASTDGKELGNATPDLWNGNIRHMVTSLMDDNNTYLTPQATAYTYDQLNRLTGMEVYQGITTGNAWNTSGSGIDQYGIDQITYDANGNIKTLHRNGDKSGSLLEMDRLTYHYNNTNQLEYVTESTDVADGDYDNDIDDQDGGNYDYDEIGNLVSDTKEEIAAIQWYVNGKIKAIIRAASSTKDNLYFAYGPDGQRIYKKVVKLAGEGVTTETWYVRDAQGNVMGVYEEKNNSLYIDEHYLYGSSRLGVVKPHEETAVEAINITTDSTRYSRYLGHKYYELSNHLGNVLVTITDQKRPTPNETTGMVDYWMPTVASYSDYYPFGMMMPGRSGGGTDEYRFGFQGQETDDEVYGEGNAVSYEYRIHDPRLGRLLSLDPLYKDFPWNSPYAFSENRVIDGREIEGCEVALIHGAGGRFTLGLYTWSYSTGIGLDREGVAYWETKGEGPALGLGITGGAGLIPPTTWSLFPLVEKIEDMNNSGVSIGAAVAYEIAGAEITVDAAGGEFKRDLSNIGVTAGPVAGYGASVFWENTETIVYQKFSFSQITDLAMSNSIVAGVLAQFTGESDPSKAGEALFNQFKNEAIAATESAISEVENQVSIFSKTLESGVAKKLGLEATNSQMLDRLKEDLDKLKKKKEDLVNMEYDSE